MSKRAWMPLYIGDYLRDTAHLSTLQHGAYMLLIMEYWTKGGFPKISKNFEKNLQKISGLSDYLWAQNRVLLNSLFTPDWRHPRIDRELEKSRQINMKRAVYGQRGADKSRGRNNVERFILAKGGSRQRGGIPQPHIYSSNSDDD